LATALSLIRRLKCGRDDTGEHHRDVGDEIVYALGDLFHYPAEFSHFDWLPAFRDRVALIASREKFAPRFAAENAWLVPAHHLFPAIGKA
jgi:hypothetical protein